MKRSQRLARLRGAVLSLGLVIVVICFTAGPAPSQSPQNTQNDGTLLNHAGGHRGLTSTPEGSDARSDAPPVLSARQKLSIMHANFERSKSDAAELAALAKALHDELNKPDGTTLTSEVINRADKIEKLAKKIRDETKGY